jgi:DNA-binding NarL/FixJ family response regulator
MSGIKILIVDTQETVRQGLRTILQLEEDLDVLGEAADGTGAIRMTDELEPQVIVMDMMISIDEGLQAIKKIKRRYPEISVVLLTSCTGITTGGWRREHGIDAIVEKEAAIHTLVRTIRRIRRNKQGETNE